MSHNVLVLPAATGDEDRSTLRALGLPEGVFVSPRPPVLRVEGLSARQAALLRGMARRSGSEAHDAPTRAHDARLRSLGWPDPGRALAITFGARRLDVREPRLAAEIEAALSPRRFGRRTLLMGILNVTPDSFSDGGRFARPRAAVRQALRMAEEGADIIDVGGESTRPGSRPVALEEELRRVMPVVEALAGRVPRISIDTTKAEVARRAALAGAVLLNDISAMTFDPAMAAVAAEHRLGVVLQHLRGRPATMQKAPRYRLLFPEVAAFLRAAAARAVRAGVAADRLIVDPGLGFGKTRVHNLALLRHLAVLRSLGRPILAGASRKSFLREDRKAPPASRLEAGLAAQALALAGGADIIRTHDVREAARVARLCDAVLKP